MNLDLDSDQAMLVQAAEKIAEDFSRVPVKGHYSGWSPELQKAIAAAGFSEVLLQDGMGPLDAALVAEVFMALPQVADVAASLIVAPAVLGEAIVGPVALVADAGRPARFIGVSRHALVLEGEGEGAILVETGSDVVAPVAGVVAYPFGRLIAKPAPLRTLSPGETAVLIKWWRTALALEAAAAMRAATRFTAAYVMERRQFGQPIGAFQAVQHRLARATVHGEGARLLALEAAAKGDPATAALAATHAVRVLPGVIDDCHQFNGALGVTLDHPLHYWTYRLEVLRSELGGLQTHAAAAAAAVWPDDAPVPAAPEPATAYGALGW